MNHLQLNVTVDEANLIVAALSELPAKVSTNLILKLQAQAAPQLANLNSEAEANQPGEQNG